MFLVRQRHLFLFSFTFKRGQPETCSSFFGYRCSSWLKTTYRYIHRYFDAKKDKRKTKTSRKTTKYEYGNAICKKFKSKNNE